MIKSRRSHFIIYFTSILLISLCLSEITINTKAQTYSNISVTTAYNMINDNATYPDLIILDVRTGGEYSGGHICNATNINVDVLESRISELNTYKNTEIIVYCRSGSRSQTASGILDDNGFTKVYNMEGGIIAWTEQGYDTCVESDTENGIGGIIIPIFIISAIGVGTIPIITYYKKSK